MTYICYESVYSVCINISLNFLTSLITLREVCKKCRMLLNKFSKYITEAVLQDWNFYRFLENCACLFGVTSIFLFQPEFSGRAKTYTENYPVIFNILLWFGVIFFFSLLAICSTYFLEWQIVFSRECLHLLWTYDMWNFHARTKYAWEIIFKIKNLWNFGCELKLLVSSLQSYLVMTSRVRN